MEADIEQGVVASAEADGWLCRKLEWQGRKGAPDQFFVKCGRVVLLEFKDHNEEARGQQLLELRRLKKAGAEVYWDIDSVRQGCKILGCPVRRGFACIR